METMAERPRTPMTRKQSASTGQKSLATFALPLDWKGKRQKRMSTASGTAQVARRGAMSSSPSTTEPRSGAEQLRGA